MEVDLNVDEANRLGVTQAQLSVYLAGALSGNNLVSLWEKDYNLPTKIYTEGVHNINYEELGDLLVPTAHPGTWVPLRQVASLRPSFSHDNLTHRNGRRCITVMADVMPGASQLKQFKKIGKYIETLDLPENVTIDEGGSMAVTKDTMPSLINSVIAAIAVMFIVLIIHYGKIGISILSISVSVLCIFGATFGLWLFGQDLSVTAMLGIISLIGIIVRNAIIMYDHAGELLEKGHLSVQEAAYETGLRRMRPIFVLTVLPVAYCLAFDAGERDKQRRDKINKRFIKRLDNRDARNASKNAGEVKI